MNCPKCKTHRLHKKDYNASATCPNCGGMWLESRKIPTFIESSEGSTEADSGKAVNDGKTGICPNGHGIMIRARIDTQEPFYLEKCPHCGGIWFDKGELREIISNNVADNLDDFWCKSWQVRHRKETSKQRYYEINKRLLGEDIFDRIIRLSELLKIHPEKGRAIALLQLEVKGSGKSQGSADGVT
jgi:Zn-finger nucleic acid-binding protein